MTAGWFKAVRGEIALELGRKHLKAFWLLYFIATRARWSKPLLADDGLQPGEALVGAFDSHGLSQQEYRTAKKVLEKYEFATFKPTTKGTIARIIDTRVFDINADAPNEQNNSQSTNKKRTDNDQITTNKKGKTGKTAKKDRETARDRRAQLDVVFMAIPTFEEVEAYCYEISKLPGDHSTSCANDFFTANQKKNWQLRGSAMKDWKKALRDWVPSWALPRNIELES